MSETKLFQHAGDGEWTTSAEATGAVSCSTPTS